MKRALCGLMLALLAPAALAAPILSITPITWDIIGLDSNDQTTGPNTFPVGARVCNTGDAAATNVTATFVATGVPNPFIALQGSSTIVTGSLPSGAAPPASHTVSATPANCADFYFNVVLTRNALAFDTTQGYRIDITADNAPGVSTPASRQLYVERLISQARNAVLTFTGPTSVQVGGIYQYTVTAKTAPGGYEQIENFPNFPNTIFRILGVSTTYSQPSGAVNSAVYADACGWDPNVGLEPPLGTYLSCVGPVKYARGKAGDDLTSVYTVQILSAGTATVSNVIHDFSGSSYHYNNDFGAAVESLTISATVPPAPVVLKSQQLVSDPINGATNPKAIPGARVNYSVTVHNSAEIVLDDDSVIVVDGVPAGTSLVVTDFGAPGSGPVAATDGTPSSGLTYTYSSLSSTTDDVSFSNDGGATYNYTPVADANGVDSTVTHIRINPKGAMNPTAANFTVRFGVRVN